MFNDDMETYLLILRTLFTSMKVLLTNYVHWYVKILVRIPCKQIKLFVKNAIAATVFAWWFGNGAANGIFVKYVIA